jgi:hypothetical protein
VYGESRTEVYGDLNSIVSPWTGDDELRRNGGVVVWQEGVDELPANFLARFPHAKQLPTLEIPYQTAASLAPLRVGAYFVPPAATSEVRAHEVAGLPPEGPLRR